MVFCEGVVSEFRRWRWDGCEGWNDGGGDWGGGLQVARNGVVNSLTQRSRLRGREGRREEGGKEGGRKRREGRREGGGKGERRRRGEGVGGKEERGREIGT